MTIDDVGNFDSNSDHNWIFVDLMDRFCNKRKHHNISKPKKLWNLKREENWSQFSNTVSDLVSKVNFDDDVSVLAHKAKEILIEAGTAEIGFCNYGGRNLTPPQDYHGILLPN